jgi:N-methylhydantoinase B
VIDDPIRFEVIRSALVAATEEMTVTLRRSAYSTNIKTRADFSCSFFDRKLRAVAQAFTQPIHLGSLVELVPRAVRLYGEDRLRAGDMIVTNDPYGGGVHLNDITVIAPVHHEGELFGYFATLAHHVDVGGAAPASVAATREVFQEGVIIPAIRLVEGGAIVDDVFRLILAQIRSKRETAGDFRAQIAANNTGARRLSALLARYGRAVVEDYMAKLIEYTRTRTRAELAQLPRGVFVAEGSIDNDGFTDDTVKLRVRVVIDDSGVVFDLSGCDPQRRAPVNSTFAQSYSACAYALKALTDPDIPVNQGFYEFVRVQAPLGTVVNARPPAPVVGGWETHVRINDLIFKALADVLPEAVPAGTKAMQCHAGFGGIAPSGEYYCFLETLAGGYGGRATKDGPDAVQAHGQNTENAPVEETEANYPVRILRYELVPDSEGPGRRRGGLGLRRDYQFPFSDTTFTILADRDKAGPWGLHGGRAGERAEYFLNPDTPGERRLSSKVTVELQPGDVISYRTCGGGGFGPPREREPELVLRDVREGKISVERARAAYGVAVDPIAWVVNTAATATLRGVPGADG